MAQNGAIVPKGGREGFSNLFGYIIILVSIDTIVSVDGCLDNQLIVTGSKDRCIGVWSLNWLMGVYNRIMLYYTVCKLAVSAAAETKFFTIIIC